LPGQVSCWFLVIDLSLLEITRMHVLKSEGARSVTKSILMWDHGRMGKGISLPSGRWWGVLEMAQTEQTLMYREASWIIPGHNYLLRRSERVCWLPRCPEPEDVWTGSKRDCAQNGL